MPTFNPGINSHLVYSSSRSSSIATEMDTDDSSSQASLTITASVSESPRLARREQTSSASLSARPRETPVTTNILKNTNGELVSAQSQPSIYQNGLNSTVNHIATITIGKINEQNAKPNGQCRPVKPDEVKPDPPKSFQILVNNFADSRNYTFEVLATELVEKLMERIKEKIGILLDQQRLTFAGKNLERGMKLSHYNIQKDSTVFLTGRLRGG